MLNRLQVRCFLVLFVASGCVMRNAAWQDGGGSTSVGSASATASDATDGKDTDSGTTTADADSTTGASTVVRDPSICAGATHNCLAVEGVLYCWGSNRFGELGDGSLATAPTPVHTPLPNPVLQVACGDHYTCAVLDDGAVACWGRNDEGALGFAGANESLDPHPIAELPAMVQVATGSAHACALASADGSVWCWGRNTYGASGTDSPGPTRILGLTDAREVVAGADHACVLLSDNSVRCWGRNAQGQVGQPAETLPSTPTPTAVDISDVVHIYAGGAKSCASKTDGSLWCWGAAADGTGGSATPSPISNFQDVVDAGLGPTHTCVARASGTVRCLGSNRFGQGGDTDPLAFAHVVRVAAGDAHTCVLDNAGELWCFGRGDVGQLGRDTWYGATPPVEVTAYADVLTLVARDEGTCQLHSQGSSSAVCWGRNEGGRLGDLTELDAAWPVDTAPEFARTTSSIALGRGHGCLTVYASSAWCWGDNDQGQLGNGTVTSSAAPVEVQGLSDLGGIRNPRSGVAHTCISIADDTVRCWGHGAHGELGNGGFADSSTAVEVAGLQNVYVMAVGPHHACAVRGGAMAGDEVGAVYCWGRNDAGQLGDGSELDRASPVRAPGSFFAITNIQSLAAGDRFTCALAGVFGAEELWCWGSNREGQWGTATVDESNQPVKVADVPGARFIAAGDNHLCLVIGEEVMCSGSNDGGQLGDGTTLRRTALTPVMDLGPVADVALGTRHTCVRSQDRRLACFGSGYFGQLGEGTAATGGATPTQVALGL